MMHFPFRACLIMLYVLKGELKPAEITELHRRFSAVLKEALDTLHKLATFYVHNILQVT